MQKRVCNVCGMEMSFGFVVDDGMEYYCCESCLATKYSRQQWNKIYAEDRGYWTEWEDNE